MLPMPLRATLPASALRHVLALLLLVAAMATPAWADGAKDRAALDLLFAELKVAPDADAAHEIDQQLWVYWTVPSDPVLAARMSDVLSARGMGDASGAIGLLDKLIADYPDYAEAWNQRATLYYAIGNYEASIADCGHVLALEPRHFGALSGRALIYLTLGKRALALKDMAAALAVHPFLVERQLFPELNRQITRI